jgi:rsbT antagonist protein RsbS
MVEVPVIILHGVLLVTIQDELLDYSVAELQQHITEQVVEHQARGVLIDISLLDVVDSFLARTLHDIAAATSLLAAKTVVVGMRTALSVEAGLALLSRGQAPASAERR